MTGVMGVTQSLGYRPRLIFWELTTGCNLRCVHCRASATELMSPDDLSYEESCAVIDQIAEYAPFILVLSGGEPLWRKDVFDLARRAASKNIIVALATNGTLVDDAMAERVAGAGIRRVAISLDGADAATHDRFRGQPGAFDAAIAGFRRLRQRGVSMQINTTVTNNNLDQIEAIYQLALELGAAAFHPFMLVPVGCGLTIQDEQMVDPMEYERVLNWVYDRALEGKMELKATCAPHYFRVVRQRRAEARRAGLPVPEIPTHGGGRHGGGVMRGCLAGSGVCFLSHLGEVYPCGYLPVSAGSVRRQAFRDIWENAAIFQELRDAESMEGKCGVCEFKQLCLGCRARAYGVSHNYLAEEPFCSYQPGSNAAKEDGLRVLDSVSAR